MAIPIEIHPEAIKEARIAREWYEARDPTAANGFTLEIDRAIIQIVEFPDRWPPYLQGTRRFLLHRYPFSVIYRKYSDRVQLLAVAHGNRRPGYWLART
jgi:plasmid stabilization system protein ParE